MTIRLVLATAHPDQAKEMVEILSAAGRVELVDRPTHVGEVEETGDTLLENARLKAMALCEAAGAAAVADDTGLVVDALGGAPGVWSARYAGEDATYDDNVTKLLAELGDSTERHARFETVAYVAFPDRRLRLRPGVHPLGRRWPNLRSDVAGGEACREPPRTSLPGPRRADGRDGRPAHVSQIDSTTSGWLP